MEHIDAILYINLDHRTDRRDHLEAEFKRMEIPADKIHRVSAIKNANGALGCTMSHIKCLKLVEEHPEWRTIMIMEDDFTFRGKKPTDFTKGLAAFFKEYNSCEPTASTVGNEAWDIFLPSYNHWNARIEDTDDDRFKRVRYSQTTSSYIFQRHYIGRLMANFRESAANLLRYGKQPAHCLDINWTKLQVEDKWFLIVPSLGYQYDNHSDIEGRVVRYGC
jgi:glycosyl transferase, family 25